MKRLSLLTACLLVAIVTMAQNFKAHRADGFYVLPQDTSDIVFIGNSITNLHNWSEAFGDIKIQNRGISAVTVSEVQPNVIAYIDGQPKKIFLMIGTNDLGGGTTTAATVFGRMKTMIDDIVAYCPNSEFYVQSILPSTANKRSLDVIRDANSQVKAYVESLGKSKVQYIDLFDLLLPVATNADGYSYDNLHLTSKAYSAWCHAIEDKVGHKTVYAPAGSITPDYGTLTNPGSTGTAPRTTVFGALPVHEDDILFLGNEMVHSGEWWELLGNLKVKNRGWGWWTPGTTIDELTAQLRPIFHDNAQPSKVFIYCGNNQGNTISDVDGTMRKYRALVDSIKRRCPRTGIYAVSLLPNAHGGSGPSAFNAQLKAFADQTDSVTYVDIYTPMVNSGTNTANATYLNSNWVTGLGYVRIANVLARYIPGCHPISEDSAKAIKARHEFNVQNKDARALPWTNLPGGRFYSPLTDIDWNTQSLTAQIQLGDIPATAQAQNILSIGGSVASLAQWYTDNTPLFHFFYQNSGSAHKGAVSYNYGTSANKGKAVEGYFYKDNDGATSLAGEMFTVELSKSKGFVINGTVIATPDKLADLFSLKQLALGVSQQGGSQSEQTLADVSISSVATGVVPIVSPAAAGSAARYNLAGQRVTSAYKGVVVMNGRKVVQK